MRCSMSKRGQSTVTEGRSSRAHARESKGPQGVSNSSCRRLARHAGVRTQPWGRGFVARNLVALQLASDLLEEPGCTVCEGSSPHITRIGIAAETSIFPESDPVARIHFVFRIDQILQSLQVDFPSGLLHCLGDTQ